MMELRGGEPQALLEGILAGGQSAGAMAEALRAALTKAAGAAGMPMRPLVGSSGGRPPDGPSRASAEWYSPECKAARRELRRAVRRFDAGSGTAVELRRARRRYKRTVRRARKVHAQGRAAFLRDALRHRPRVFWALLKSKTAGAGDITKRAWYEYFAELHQPPQAALQPPAQPTPAPAAPGGLWRRCAGRAVVCVVVLW